MEKAGVNKEQLRNARETGDQNVVENLINKIKRNEKKEKQKKINKSRYNNIYKDVMTEDAPKYLNVRNSKDRSLIARYKCRNETKGSQHWREEDRRCRICRAAEESMFHILNECEASKNELRIEEFVEEKGLKLMKWIEKVRRETREKIG